MLLKYNIMYVEVAKRVLDKCVVERKNDKNADCEEDDQVFLNFEFIDDDPEKYR